LNINVDGQKGKGVGIFGGAMGLGAVFWTLVSLWLLTSASLATTLYCLGAIQFVMALPVAFMAPGWIFYGVAAAAGPIVAYCVSQNRVYRGKSEAGAYNPFFYAAAGLSFGNFLLIGTMGWLERRAVAAESRA
jgi:hypothetical protein